MSGCGQFARICLGVDVTERRWGGKQTELLPQNLHLREYEKLVAVTAFKEGSRIPHRSPKRSEVGPEWEVPFG
jgi:hypothetical protein